MSLDTKCLQVLFQGKLDSRFSYKRRSIPQEVEIGKDKTTEISYKIKEPYTCMDIMIVQFKMNM